MAGLLSSRSMSVKPFAHAVGDYVRCDRHDKTDDNVQCIHPPSAAGIGEDSTAIIPKFGKSHKENPLAKFEKTC